MELKIKKVKDNAKIPKIATSGAAGMDLYACITEKITVEPQKIAVIPTGIAIELPNPVGCRICLRQERTRHQARNLPCQRRWRD